MNQRGFTLIELLVSVAIFSVVMVIALGALLSIVNADRKADAIAAAMNNVNFSVESMTRSIRTGYNYHCATSTGGDCTSGSGGEYFAFTAADRSFVEYRRDTTTAGCTVNACISRQVTPQSGSPGGFIPITASDISVSSLRFYLIGYCSKSGRTGATNSTVCTADTIQPKVTILLAGSAQVNNATTTFAIQTSVTQRLYDL
jgi:prepilin-type N-terminal cleavage/methylation domain-containing protein